MVTEPLRSSPGWLSLEPGAYGLAVTAAGETFYERSFTVEKGAARTFVVPRTPSANIRVSVDDRSGPVGPGSQLEFAVESSGNGYVWVFEERPGAFTLIYPEGCPAECGNEVSVDRPLHLPDPRQRALFAGTRAGEERLLFLVTSSKDSGAAKRLAGRFENAAVLKASSGVAGDNWGYAEVSYRVLAR